MNSAKIIKNITAGTLIIHDIAKDADGIGNQSLTLLTQQVFDLSTKYEQDETAFSKGLDTAIASAQVEVIENYSATDLTAIVAWITAGDTLLQFFEVNGPSTDNVYSGPKEGTEVSVGVTNGVGTLNPFNNTSTVEIAVTGGTAADPKINGVVGPVLVKLVGGRITADITATAAGTVLLGLQNGNTTLNRADTATVNLS